ncbi:hypothetical protein A3Q56_07981, partial [Intoshia linei]
SPIVKFNVMVENTDHEFQKKPLILEKPQNLHIAAYSMAVFDCIIHHFQFDDLSIEWFKCFIDSSCNQDSVMTSSDNIEISLYGRHLKFLRDILFDAKTHKLKKIILHSNYPHHYNFGTYNRCYFQIPITFTPDKINESTQIEENFVITPHVKWDEILEKCDLCDLKRVILRRTPSLNNTNPFPYTVCYGYENLIFEVLKNSCISSITILSHD